MLGDHGWSAGARNRLGVLTEIRRNLRGQRWHFLRVPAARGLVEDRRNKIQYAAVWGLIGNRSEQFLSEARKCQSNSPFVDF